MKKTIEEFFSCNVKIKNKGEYDQLVNVFKQFGYTNKGSYEGSRTYYIFKPKELSWLGNKEIDICSGGLRGVKTVILSDILALSQEGLVEVSKEFLTLSYQTAKTTTGLETLAQEIEDAVKGQSVFSTKFTVPKSLVIKGYEKACPEWKKKIAANFPEIIQVESPKQIVENLIKEQGKVHGYHVEIIKESDWDKKFTVLVPLPSSNHEWSVNAFNWGIEFCKKAKANNKIRDIYIAHRTISDDKMPGQYKGYNYYVINISVK